MLLLLILILFPIILVLGLPIFSGGFLVSKMVKCTNTKSCLVATLIALIFFPLGFATGTIVNCILAPLAVVFGIPGLIIY
jgi:hypothetical protein